MERKCPLFVFYGKEQNTDGNTKAIKKNIMRRRLSIYSVDKMRKRIEENLSIIFGG